MFSFSHSNTETRPYEYTKLSNPHKEIRILNILPWTGNAKDRDVHCTMSTLDISRKENGSRASKILWYSRLPTYSAVSHVWGSGAELVTDHEIYVDGRVFAVTKKVYNGMVAILGAMGTTIWVDTICINQKDNEEKSAQIPLMLEIYQLTAFVTIWLGDATEETKKALDFITISHSKSGKTEKVLNMVDSFYQVNADQDMSPTQRIMLLAEGATLTKAADLAFHATRGRAAVADVYGVPQQPSATQNETAASNPLTKEDLLQKGTWQQRWHPEGRGLEFILKHNLQEITNLLLKILVDSTQYLKRMWTLQEAAVNRRVMINYGRDGVGLRKAIDCLGYLSTQSGVLVPDGALDELLKLHNLAGLWDQHILLPLWRLLYEFSSRACMDPRDRIFALQALMKERDEKSPLLKSDYSKSVEEVYSNATLYFIAQRQSLDVICGHPRGGKGISSFPSWVLDYQFHSKQHTSLIQIDQTESIYKASPKRYSTMLPENTTPLDWSALECSGITIGLITALSRQTNPADSLHMREMEYREILQTDTSKPRLAAIECVSTVVELCSLFDSGDPEKLAIDWSSHPHLPQKFQEAVDKLKGLDEVEADYAMNYLLTLVCGRWKLDCRGSAKELVEKLATACIRDSKGDQELAQLNYMLSLGMGSRRLAILDGDPQMAMVPSHAIIHDLICVLDGCSVPVVLRHVGGRQYSFIDECYVHGLMDGEAIELKNRGICSEQEFCLR